MTGTMAFAFLIGTITTVNPCGFVLLPAYLARRLGTDAAGDGDRLDAVLFAITIGASATAGFVLVFGIVGGAMVLGANWLTNVFPWAGFVIGITLAVTGLAVMAGLRIGLRLPTAKFPTGGSGLSGDFFYGVGYAIVSLSCSLPIFLAVMGVAFSETALSSVLNFIAFSLGVGTVLTALSVSAVLARKGLAARLKSFLPYANRAGGAVLFLAGLYVSYLWGSALFTTGLPGNDMLAAGERISGTLRGWFGGLIGQTVAATVLAFLITGFIWIRWSRRVAKEPGK